MVPRSSVEQREDEMNKPIPTVLKILNGNPGHRPLNKDEPMPDAAIPTCPSHLDEVAVAEWDRLVPELYELGLLTKIDRTSLAAYCQLYSRWVDAERQIQKQGTIIEQKHATSETFKLVKNPYVGIAEVALVQMKSWATEFGLTPSSRSKVVITNVGEQKKKERAKELAEKYF